MAREVPAIGSKNWGVPLNAAILEVFAAEDATAIARDEAVQAAEEAAAVGATTDTAIAGAINTPGSATETALNDTIATATADLLTRGASRFFAALRNRYVTPVVVVMAGSSTTAGTAASSIKHRYVNRISDYLHAAFPLVGGAAQPATVLLAASVAAPPSTPGIHVVNAGVGGTIANTYLTATTRPQVAALKPSLITHMVGSNDFRNQRPVADYKADVLAQIAGIDAAMTTPHVHLLIHSYEAYDGTTERPIRFAEYGKALREISEARPNEIAFIDVSAEFVGIGIPSTDPFGFMDADKIHMNNYGHAFMADTLRKRLGLLWVPATFVEPAVPGLPPVATVWASDSFAGVDGTAIAGRSLDLALGGTARAWVGSTTGPRAVISGNAVGRGSEAGTQAFMVLAPTASQSAKITMAQVFPSGQGGSLDIRRTTVATANVAAYRLGLNGGTAVFSKRDGTTSTNLAPAFAYVAGDVLEIQALTNEDGLGSTITCLKNGVVVETVQDATLPNAGYSGFEINSAFVTGTAPVTSIVLSSLVAQA